MRQKPGQRSVPLQTYACTPLLSAPRVPAQAGKGKQEGHGTWPCQQHLGNMCDPSTALDEASGFTLPSATQESPEPKGDRCGVFYEEWTGTYLLNRHRLRQDVSQHQAGPWGRTLPGAGVSEPAVSGPGCFCQCTSGQECVLASHYTRLEGRNLGAAQGRGWQGGGSRTGK